MLDQYKRKRNFKKTPEPLDSEKSAGSSFVIQEHWASHYHFDLRLELDGVLKSWAIPKSLPLKKNEKHLAQLVEDHPLGYQEFEGVIPEGNYGAGTVMVFDHGYFICENFSEQFKEGNIKFELRGKKLNGNFHLIKTKIGWLIFTNQDQNLTNDFLKLNSSLSGKTFIELTLEKRIKSLKKVSQLPQRNDALIKPMLAKTVDVIFSEPDWIFELKFDGYRTIADIKRAKKQLYSRNWLDFKEKFKIIYDQLRVFKFNVIFDGEVVAFDTSGRPSFQKLQNIDSQSSQLFYYVFDIVELEGHDLTGLTLSERKKILEEIFIETPNIKLTDFTLEKGEFFFEQVVKFDFEGIMAKRLDSLYQSGKRSGDWLKIKNQPTDEAVIVGYTKGKGTRNYFGSLILAQEVNGELKLVGNVGTGFDEKTLKKIFGKLSTLKPSEAMNTDKDAIWVEPKYFAQVRFTEKTGSNSLRHPVFLGLREDKFYEQSNLKLINDQKIKTISHNGQTFELSNPNKIFFNKLGLTKLDLAKYYIKIFDKILPYIKDRPESLNRYPDGVSGEHFYHKDIEHKKDWMNIISIGSDNRKTDYLICNDLKTLVYMINLGCIEINPWLSKTSNLKNPDILVFDLDPGDKASFDQVIETASAIKNYFDKISVKTYFKTSGATGIHVYIHLNAKHSYDSARLFAQLVATEVSGKLPFTSVDRNPKTRIDKVYIDFLQNRFGQTIAAPYSVRPNEQATISTPVGFEQMKKIKPSDYHILNVSDDDDPWFDFFQESYDLGDLLTRIKSSKF